MRDQKVLLKAKVLDLPVPAHAWRQLIIHTTGTTKAAHVVSNMRKEAGVAAALVTALLVVYVCLRPNGKPRLSRLPPHRPVTAEHVEIAEQHPLSWILDEERGNQLSFLWMSEINRNHFIVQGWLVCFA